MAMGNDSFTGIPSKDNEGINDGVRWVVVNGVGVDTPTTQYIKKKKGADRIRHVFTRGRVS
jgi:hypothetical protein